MDVTLEPVTADTVPVLSNLLPLYVHDMSEFFPLEVGADGRFRYERLPLYQAEPERRFAFLIRAGGRLAGFVLATRDLPGSDDPGCLDVAEFFVLRGERRHGVGRRAAFLLWDRLPGRWAVRVAETNRAGVPFWRAVVEEYTHGRFTESRRTSRPPDRRVFHFTSRGAG